MGHIIVRLLQALLPSDAPPEPLAIDERLQPVSRVRLARIDDPRHSYRLLGLGGAAVGDDFEPLVMATTDLPPGSGVHIDVHGLMLATPEAAYAFGDALDRLEQRQLRVRVVGLRPTAMAFA